MSNNDIMQTWQWCRDNYSRHNICLSFPSNTDPTKTYQWRYLAALQRKFTEWNFDESLRRQFIIVAIDYAKQYRLLRKGLAIFHQNNLLTICYNRLKEKLVDDELTQSSLKRVKVWVDSKATNGHLNEILLHRAEIGGYTNIVKWYQSHKLNDAYLALSKSCGIALAKLANSDTAERSLLPSAIHLLTLRMKLLHDARAKNMFQTLLGDDWRKSC